MRFAPLIRVSTEGQAQKGESLRTQTGEIQQYVKSLNGTIPEYCWKYSGQEHATPEQERAKLEQLLKDSANRKFDAVIVCDTSRWSRDNQKSKEGLNILRDNGVKFFVGTMEYDLYNPEHNFILGMSAEVGELQARQQSLKSITNRIQRARRNIPTSGKLPYGRTFDKKSETWGIDPEKQKNIQWAAKQYLNGMSIVHIAKLLEMNFTNLWKILTQRSGTTWECRFQNKKVNVDETVQIEIPPLLDEQTIQAINEKGQANKTYSHGEIKNRYLLSRMIFCQRCGYALMGQTNHNTKRYYRHPKHRKRGCNCKKWVPAELIEKSVLLHLFNLFGDVERIQKAIERATPDMDKVKEMRQEYADLKQKEMDKIKERERLVKFMVDGKILEEEGAKLMDEIRSKLQAITNRIEHLEPLIQEQPDPEKIKKKAKMAQAVLQAALQSPAALFKMDYDQQRKLVEHAFGGKDREGNRLGVYVEETGKEKRPWRFEIRAVLDNMVGSFLPMFKSEVGELLKLDEDASVDEALEGIDTTNGSFVLS